MRSTPVQAPPSPEPIDRADASPLELDGLYDQLRSMARARLARAPAQTLGATDVVHEALARLLKSSVPLDDLEEEHLLALASRAMRNVMVDRARARSASKRDRARMSSNVDLDASVFESSSDEEVVLVHEALDALAEVDERAAQVVELRFFGGLSQSEAADLLGVNERTVRRDWRFARAWLLREIGEDAG
ncbi:MAG: ECF-type sigma factor [Planctomycetota bacterium]